MEMVMTSMLLFKFQQKKFWFATGGAGFCLSRALVNKMRPYVRYCSCIISEVFTSWCYLIGCDSSQNGANLLTWLATNETEGNCISPAFGFCILIFFWSQLTNLFVRNFKQTSFFLSVRHFGVFVPTKAVFLAGIGIENGWCLTLQINARKPPERHVNKRDDLFCLSDFVFRFLVMVNS